MGKRSRPHREAVQNGTEQPFRQHPRGARISDIPVRAMDWLPLGTIIAVLASGKCVVVKNIKDTDPIPATIPEEVKE